MFTGPKIKKDNLKLKFDTANFKSFKGDSTTNLLTTINWQYGTQDTPLFKTNYGTELLSIPNIEGKRLVNYCNVYNDYNGGSGNCCPALFAFGDITVLPNTTYTFQIIYKTSSNYFSANYMYHYEYNGGTYVTEYGLLDSSRTKDLGNGWVHGWGTFTSNASTNRFVTYLFHYEYATQTKIQVAGISLTLGSTIHEPKFILPVNTTRGTTVATGGGLRDLSGKQNHGSLVNGPIFKPIKNGVITFDGVNDYVSIPNTTLGNGDKNWVVNAWVKTTTSVNGLGLGSILSNTSGGPVYSMLGINNGRIVYWTYQNSSWAQKLGNKIVNDDNWHYLTWVNYSNYTMDMYVDGVLDVNVSNSTSGNNNPVNIIGGSWAGYFSGQLSNIEIIDGGTLNTDDVQQNYNATKGRFNL